MKKDGNSHQHDIMLGLFNLNAMVDVLLWFIPGVFFRKKLILLGFIWQDYHVLVKVWLITVIGLYYHIRIEFHRLVLW